MKSSNPSKLLWKPFMAEQETFLKTQQVADALGVSVSTIKRWVDVGSIEATRTMGKHRLVALSSALKFARDEKFPTGNLLAMSGHPRVAAIDESLVEALLEALKFGKVGETSEIIQAAFLATRDAVSLADDLIRPLMQRVGQLWLVGAWDVYQEHQATLALANTLTDLISKSPRPGGPRRPLAIGAAPEGDVYTLPCLLGEMVLREVGWDVRNLGPNLPLRSLASAIREYRPKLVFLSTSVVADRAQFLQNYAYFYEAATQVRAAIIVGGRALDADLRSRLVYASFGDRMAHLAEFGRQLLLASEASLGAISNQSEPMDTSN